MDYIDSSIIYKHIEDCINENFIDKSNIEYVIIQNQQTRYFQIFENHQV